MLAVSAYCVLSGVKSGVKRYQPFPYPDESHHSQDLARATLRPVRFRPYRSDALWQERGSERALVRRRGRLDLRARSLKLGKMSLGKLPDQVKKPSRSSRQCFSPGCSCCASDCSERTDKQPGPRAWLRSVTLPLFTELRRAQSLLTSDVRSSKKFALSKLLRAWYERASKNTAIE